MLLCGSNYDFSNSIWSFYNIIVYTSDAIFTFSDQTLNFAEIAFIDWCFHHFILYKSTKNTSIQTDYILGNYILLEDRSYLSIITISSPALFIIHVEEHFSRTIDLFTQKLYLAQRTTIRYIHYLFRKRGIINEKTLRKAVMAIKPVDNWWEALDPYFLFLTFVLANCV